MNNERESRKMTRLGRLNRRNFLKMGLGALSAAAAVEIGGAGLLYLRSRSLEGKYGGVVVTGVVDEFPKNSVTEFAEEGFYLVRAKDGGFLALYRRCPHLGCIVDWDQEKGRFFCPCHASTFDFYGAFFGPPVPRSLDLLKVTIEENEVIVDTSQIEHREQFDVRQLAYA